MLTSQQDIPSRPEEKVSWTARPLIALRSAVATMAKTFNALEAILLFEVFISGLGELAGRRLSIGWYVILACTLGVNAYLRIFKKENES